MKSHRNADYIYRLIIQNDDWYTQISRRSVHRKMYPRLQNLGEMPKFAQKLLIMLKKCQLFKHYYSKGQYAGMSRWYLADCNLVKCIAHVYVHERHGHNAYPQPASRCASLTSKHHFIPDWNPSLAVTCTVDLHAHWTLHHGFGWQCRINSFRTCHLLSPCLRPSPLENVRTKKISCTKIPQPQNYRKLCPWPQYLIFT